MNTCTVEIGLLRKHPCGHAAVSRCLNCDQPLCVEHGVAQLTEGGSRTGKFMCKECLAAEKEYAKSMAGVARTQEQRKTAALDKQMRDQIAHPPTPKKPAADAHHAPAQPAAAEKPKGPDVIEFTPTKKEDKPG